MINLNNECLSVKIDEKGAQLKSVFHNGTEYMWGADPLVWPSTAPIMFPICGGLKDDSYFYNGKKYPMIKHGFCRMYVFEVESAEETKAVLLLKSNEETKKSYPFDFEFRVFFELEGKTVKINYQVTNTGADTMFFNVGSHEGFATPEGIEDYDIIFDENVTLNSHYICGNLAFNDTFPILKDSKVLPLYDKYFVVEPLMFSNISAKAATLRNRKTGRSLRLDFPDAKHLVLWHKESAGFMCIEPWNGYHDFPEADSNLENKKGITSLDSGKQFDFRHTITVEG